MNIKLNKIMDKLIFDNNLSQLEKFFTIILVEIIIKKWETLIKRWNIIKNLYI